MSMKLSEFVQGLKQDGCSLKRYGDKHDVYENEAAMKVATVPKAPVLAGTLCKEIRRQLGV
jgi:predicted RNA binding protein YcfA (HicA-like mRNA interferase family)